MHIWVITQYFKPEIGAPVARLGGFASVWQSFGQKVTVLTGQPNHPHGVLHEAYKDKPKYFEEEIDGVRVKRHWLYITKNEGRFKRAFNQLSFMLSLLWGHIKLEKDPAKRPDVIIASSPSFFAVISAWVMARRYKVPFIFEVRDLWPAIFVEMGILKPGFILNTLERLELFLYKRADAIVTVTKGYAATIAGRGIDPHKIYTITNGVADKEIAQVEVLSHTGVAEKLRQELQIDALTKVVLYIGNHGEAQALGQVVDAARQLIDQPNILFLMVGEGSDRDRLLKLGEGLPNLRFLPSQPREKVWPFYLMADVGIVCLKDIEGFKTTIPSKMFEIMAAGTPIVAGVAGEAAQILQHSGAAQVVPPEHSTQMAEAIRVLVADTELYNKSAAAGPLFVRKHFTHSALAGQYVGIFQKLIAAKEQAK